MRRPVVTRLSLANHKKRSRLKSRVRARTPGLDKVILEGQMRRFEPVVFRIVGLALAAAVLCGCGMSMPSMGDRGLFAKRKQETWTPIITEESMLTAARQNSDGPIEMAAANGCPILQVEPGRRDITLYAGNRVGNSRAVIHHSEITKTARECKFDGGIVEVKYGIAGRVLLGPKGKPGPVILPATMKVLDRTRNKLASEPFTLNVTITRENPISYFAVVRDVSIPVREGTQPGDYSITIAFEKKRPGAA